MEVGSQSVGRNESSRWPHAAENAREKNNQTRYKKFHL